MAPAVVCGNSKAALSTLRLAAARSELVRGIAVHEPPGVPLLSDDQAFAPVTEAYGAPHRPVRDLLEAEDNLAAAAERSPKRAPWAGAVGAVPGVGASDVRR